MNFSSIIIQMFGFCWLWKIKLWSLPGIFPFVIPMQVCISKCTYVLQPVLHPAFVCRIHFPYLYELDSCIFRSLKLYPVWQTWFLLYFKLGFYKLQQAEKSSSNWEKIEFIKLDISNWRIAKNQVQIDRGSLYFWCIVSISQVDSNAYSQMSNILSKWHDL